MRERNADSADIAPVPIRAGPYPPGLLSARAAARELGISERTVRRAIARAELSAAKYAGTFRIAPADLDRYRSRLTGTMSLQPADASEPVERGGAAVQVGNVLLLASAAPPLPIAPTPLIGRERELAALLDLFRGDERRDLEGGRGVRLVTLTGPGGVGKTRLALAVATALHDAADFGDGVWFVPLAHVADPALVVPAIAQTFGLREAGGRPLAERLGRFLRSRRLLLVLDNVEQVVEAAPAVAALLEVAPRLSVLVTSREVLRVSAEHDFPVSPLATPDPARVLPVAEVANAPAVQLFVARVQAAAPDFALTPENAVAVAATCRRLDGLPLAIELAAPRVRLFAPNELLERLGRRLPILTGGPRDLPARLRTMRDAIAWSYDLLTAKEQALFRCLAVFAGGFTLEAAEAVATEGAEAGGREGELHPASPPSRLPASSVLDGVQSLVDKSLLRSESGGAGKSRFALLETIREYGLEQLEASGEATALGEAHAAYFLGLAERAAASLASTAQENVHALLVPEAVNLRAAGAFFAGQGETESALRLIVALRPLWWYVGDTGGARRSLVDYLAVAGDVAPAVRTQALILAARFDAVGGDCERALPLAEEALALARAHGDAPGEGYALETLGMIHLYSGRLTEARRRLDDAVASHRARGDRHRLGHALCQFAMVGDFGAIDRPADPDDLVRATAQGEEALALFRAIGQPISIARALFGLGYLAYRGRDYPRAAALLRESIALRWELRDLSELAEPLEDLADVSALTGNPGAAARLYGVVEVLRETIGRPVPAAARAEYEREVAISRAALSEAAFAEALAAGRALPLEEAIAEALAPVEAEDGRRQAGVAGLTRREREVLRLLCEGASNQAIADALFIGPATAKSHVISILAKLGVDSRTAAVVYAHRHGVA